MLQIKKQYLYLPPTDNYNIRGQIPRIQILEIKPKVVIFRKGIRVPTPRVVIVSHTLGSFILLILIFML